MSEIGARCECCLARLFALHCPALDQPQQGFSNRDRADRYRDPGRYRLLCYSWECLLECVRVEFGLALLTEKQKQIIEIAGSRSVVPYFVPDHHRLVAHESLL